jgi:hypothetical protein
MLTGGKKVEKPQRTKFRKNTDNLNLKNSKKPKHHDRSFYRLVKEEKEYVL